MFDIGIGEIIVIAVIGLLVFGPDRLPRAAADAARWLRDIRGMASGARKELADSAGIDLSETVDTVRSLQEFHPRRLAASLLKDDGAGEADTPGAKGAGGPGGSADGSATSADRERPAERPAFDPDAT
jgi:sec-independent protein translocase protein TatB